MGTKNKALLAALVSLAMMFSFAMAIGLVPTAVTGEQPRVTAATGGSALAISADGAAPAGDSFAIPVGSSQSFSALGAGGAVEWSLASDGAASLSVSGSGDTAIVTALAPGSAGLYVSSSGGSVDLLNLSLVGGKSGEKDLSSLTITNPVNGSSVFHEVGATNIPLTMTSEVDDPKDTLGVQYTYDGDQMASAAVPPYPALIPDVTALTNFTIQAAAASYSRYTPGMPNFDVMASSTFSVNSVNADQNGDGYPDNPFALNLGPNDVYINVVLINGKPRVVVVKRLPDASKLVDLPSEGTTVSATHPDDETRSVSAIFPSGLVEAGETALAVVVIGDDLEALAGAQAGDAIVQNQPADGLVPGGLFAEVSVLVSDDNGATFSELDTDRLIGNPVTIINQGTQTLAGDNVNVFSFESNATPSPLVITPAEAGTWAKSALGTSVQAGAVSTQTESLSVFAPFSTPNDLNIVSITNVSGGNLDGTPQDYAIGGGDLEIRVANVLAKGGAPVLRVFIDGDEVTVDNQITDGSVEVVTVTVPEANALAAPAEIDDVDVRVELAGDSSNFDVEPNGLTYLGPVITMVDPDIGTQLGGTTVTVTGAGFGTGLTATLGGNAMTGVSPTGSTSFTGDTSAGGPGIVDLVVTLPNNYRGTASNAFTYEPAPPVITSLFPDTVFDDGGYQVRVNGEFFLSPDTVFKSAKAASVYNSAFFTVVKDEQNPGADSPAASVRFLDDSRLNVLTPARTITGMYNIYVANNIYRESEEKTIDNFFSASNLEDFTFFELSQAAYTITDITPNEGPKTGNTTVAITGQGFPPATGGGGGNGGGDDVVTGQTIRVEEVVAGPGATNVQVRFYLVRGDDVQESDPSPASMGFRIEFDDTLIAPFLSGNPPAPFVQAGPNLGFFYGKNIQTGLPQSNQVSLVISGGTTEITTCDDQIPSNPVDTHDPDNCQNPFLLGTLFFNVLGNAGETSPLTIRQVSMASGGAQTIPANTDNGRFCIGTECPDETEEPFETSVDVYFGPNAATVLAGPAKGNASSSTVSVRTPAAFPAMNGTADPLQNRDDLFVDGFAVDVRVQDKDDPTMFAISRAASEYNLDPPSSNSGFTYLNVVPPMITEVTPSTGWVFGGQVVTINGQGFEGGDISVTIGGQDAPFAPGFTQSDTQLNVLAPARNVAGRTEAVDVTVTVAETARKSVGEDTATGAYTYVRYDFQSEGDSNGVFTNAFFFDASAGANVNLVLAFNTAGLKGSSEVPGNLQLPANLPTGGAGTVYGIIRSSKTPAVVGTDNLTQAPNGVGDPIGNIWNFDLHLYEGEFPYMELGGISLNTDQTPATIAFPTNDTSLSLANLETGGVTNWSTQGGAFDYTFANRNYTPANNTPQYQSLVTKANIAAKTNIGGLTGIKLYDISQSSFAVIQNAPPPLDQVNAQLDPDRPDEGPVGTDVHVIGDNIGWSTTIRFTPTAKGGGTFFDVVPTNRGDEDSLLIGDTTGIPAGEYALTLLVPTNAKGIALAPVPVSGTFTLTDARPRIPFATLLGALLALFGLLAGGDSGGGGGGPCFVATAAYGTPMAAEIEVLRSVRDSFLLNNVAGTAMVDAYYTLSPAIADVIAANPVLAGMVRLVLVPVIAIGKLALAIPHVSMALAALAFLALALRTRKTKVTKA